MSYPTECQVVVDQDVIDTMEPLLAELLDQVLDLDLASCLVTDLSSLSDFAPRGLPDGSVAADATYGEILDAWDLWVANRVEAVFGVRPTMTSAPLVSLLGAIERHRAASLH